MFDCGFSAKLGLRKAWAKVEEVRSSRNLTKADVAEA